MKPIQPDDPHELVGVACRDGNADFMALCIIEEYMLLGWSDRQILTLFTQPRFRMTHQIYRERGHRCVESLIARVRGAWADNGLDAHNA